MAPAAIAPAGSKFFAVLAMHASVRTPQIAAQISPAVAPAEKFTPATFAAAPMSLGGGGAATSVLETSTPPATPPATLPAAPEVAPVLGSTRIVTPALAKLQTRPAVNPAVHAAATVVARAPAAPDARTAAAVPLAVLPVQAAVQAVPNGGADGCAARSSLAIPAEAEPSQAAGEISVADEEHLVGPSGPSAPSAPSADEAVFDTVAKPVITAPGQRGASPIAVALPADRSLGPKRATAARGVSSPAGKPVPQAGGEQSVGAPVDRGAGARRLSGVTEAPPGQDFGATPACDDEQALNAVDQGAVQAGEPGDGSVAAPVAATPATPAANTAAPAPSLAGTAAQDSGAQAAVQSRTPVFEKHVATSDESDSQAAVPAAPDFNLDGSPQPEAVTPPAAPTPQTAPPPSASTGTPAVIVQVGRAVAGVHVAAGGQGHITINLQPGDLGAVQVRIERAADGSATVTVQVEKSATLQTMQQDISHLHQALDRAGVPSELRQVTLQLATPATASSFGTGTDSGSGFPHGGQSQPQSQSQSQPQQSHSMEAASQDADSHDETGLSRWMPVGINITA
jgi:hypothetical protein